MDIATIAPKELAARRQRGELCELIDVRTPAEFREVHVAFARNMPLDQLDPSAFKKSSRGEQPLYVICRSGQRASKACEKLVAAAINNVVNVDGGTSAWVQAGLPVIRGKKMVSLERQARIGIGSLVLIGSALTWFVHPYWIGLPAFMGAGLIFSGIADFCGFALLLARMPWNRIAPPDNQTSSEPIDSAKSCCT